MLGACGTCEFKAPTVWRRRASTSVTGFCACLRPAAPSSPAAQRGTNRAPTTMDELSEGQTVPREPGYGSKRRQDAEAQRTCRERRAGCPTRTSGDGAWSVPSRTTHPAADAALARPYALPHEHLPLPDLLGRDPRDPRQARLPPVRRDSRDLLRGRTDGVPGRRRGRATLTIGATGNLTRRVSFRVRKDRSGEGSLPAAQTGPVTVSLRIGAA
jgi:hypothetical protein